MSYQCSGHIPELEGSRIRLRPLEEGDAPALYACWTDEEVRKYSDLPDLPDESAAAELIRLLNRLAATEDGLRWGILLPEAGIIGSCGFNWWQLEGAYRGEIGCELARPHWGKGYMREAIGLMLGFGYRTMGLNRIEALTDPRNERAVRLFGSLGFTAEGRLRQYRHTASGFHDALLHSLLREEWEQAEHNKF